VKIERNPVILKKVGSINQAPTSNQNPIQNNQLIQIRKGGFDESNPYKKVQQINQTVLLKRKVRV
jgi:hypothetical protein